MSIAFVFPGQGSQSVGMVRSLAEVDPVVRETFVEASAVLDFDLWRLVEEGPEAELNMTAVTQPAILAASVATWRVWRRRGGLEPDFVAGHSLGEYSALVCADSLSFETAVALVQQRGRFMQEAVAPGEGAMAAIIGLPVERLRDICDRAAQGDVLDLANFNSPQQTVIAGTKGAVERAVAMARTEGARHAAMLPVSAPFHCALMQPAARAMAPLLKAAPLCAPLIPLVNNVDAAVAIDPDAISSALIRQIAAPVRWVETIETLVERGVKIIIECGPGKVLAGLNRRIAPAIEHASLHDGACVDAALQLCKQG